MKSVIISIRPEWCEKIFNGEKTIEVRKTAPKPPFKVVVYCTKSNNALAYLMSDKSVRISDKREYGIKYSNKNIVGSTSCGVAKNINGKVIGEFVCDKVDFVAPWGIEDIPLFYSDKWVKEILKKACLTCDEAIAYQGNKSDIYAWHITALKIYDKPRELAEFYKPCKNLSRGARNCNNCDYSKFKWYGESTHIICRNTITRPPQSWQYMEEE